MVCANPYGEHATPYGNLLALTIDHLGGGGSEHRRKTRYWSFYKWLARQGFPRGYQVLCMNCQMIKKFVNNEMHSELAAYDDDRLRALRRRTRQLNVTSPSS